MQTKKVHCALTHLYIVKIKVLTIFANYTDCTKVMFFKTALDNNYELL